MGQASLTSPSMESSLNERNTALRVPEAEATEPSPAGRIPEIEVEAPIEQAPPPAYSGTYGEVDISQDGFDTHARIASTL